jgi:hypothetical protein
VKPFPIALAATLHDATGALDGHVARALPRLQRLYAGVAVTTSPPTARRITARLEAAGVWAGEPRTNTRGPLYRMAIRGALSTHAPAVHYLDFDRAVHWARVAPDELAAVLRVARRHPALLVGRTDKAHALHHRPLWATEVLANRLMAGALGVEGRLDLLVPSFVVQAPIARELVRRSRARDEGLYGEWAALLAALAPVLAYVECRGLDWETPDRYRRSIRRMGLAAWRRRQETPAEWAFRTAMAGTIVRAFTRRRVATAPKIVRIPQRARASAKALAKTP